MTATHLAWSDEIGKRVRTGEWADQAVSTVTKIKEAVEEAGDVFDPPRMGNHGKTFDELKTGKSEGWQP